MPRSSLFTDREWEAITDLAIESACDRYRTDRSALRDFLRERRLSPVESEAVAERCKKDADYLHTLVAEYVDHLRGMDLVGFLAEQRPRSEITRRLGFDPFDPRRQEAFRRAQRTFNPMQGAALSGGMLLGLVLTLILSFFVPEIEQTWVVRVHSGYRATFFPVPFRNESKTLEKEQIVGYGSVFVSKPDSRWVETSRTPFRDMNAGPPALGEDVTYRYTSYRRDFSWFFGGSLALWIAIVTVTAVLVVRGRSKPWSAERYAATLVRAEPGGVLSSDDN